jgi:hypothetical protein
VFWGRVSERMGGRRGRQQCRIKWSVTQENFIHVVTSRLFSTSGLTL